MDVKKEFTLTNGHLLYLFLNVVAEELFLAEAESRDRNMCVLALSDKHTLKTIKTNKG